MTNRLRQQGKGEAEREREIDDQINSGRLTRRTAENEYAARVRIRELEAQLSDTATRLEEANGDIASFQSQVKQLQSESAHKTLVAVRFRCAWGHYVM